MGNENTEKQLLSEIEKWTAKINKELDSIETYGSKGEDFIKNIRAYVQDSAHFLESRDPVRSFEAIIWAWSWLEIGKELGFLSREYIRIGKT